MSNALAIAVVTAVLKDILENGLANDAIATTLGDILITALPPDRISIGTDERSQLNIFLYQISPNRNADWLMRARPELQQLGAARESLLAFDLHFLLTAYGAKDFYAELLLGYVIQLLHDIPVLTQDMVYTALKHAAEMTTFGVLSQALAAVSVEQLAEQLGPIKLNQEFLGMEETSKLWSSLQTHYRPSCAYQASMVLMKSPQPSASGSITAITVSQPVIEQIGTGGETGRLLVSGDPLVIRGKHLQGSLTRIRLDGRSKLLSPQQVQDTQISLSLPTDLLAGMHSVQVIHLDASPGSAARSEIESNLETFVLQPTVLSTVNSVQPQNELRQVQLQLKVKPSLGKSQHTTVLLHCLTPPTTVSYRYSIPQRDSNKETLELAAELPAGTYWVQIAVDGAFSRLPSNGVTAADGLQIEIA
ncbi:DUF4255 domain-containing protein [Phormidium tenue FACHB-886]|nr:DUF4255 domain-containing protein [Phormidium tenue FACHB-886]